MAFASTFTMLWLWKKEIVFMLLLRSLFYDRAKKINQLTFQHYFNWAFILLFCYVHYAMILQQNKINFYYNTIFTTEFLIKKE